MTTQAIATTEKTQPLTTFTPRADIYAVETGYQVQVELPGVALEDLQITLEQSTLTLRGQTGDLDYAGYRGPARGAIAYERSFHLSESVEGDAIQAEFKDGLLTLTLPKAERALPRQIPVEFN